MLERISCRNCDSPNCEGCNIYILETMLNSGKLDCLMDEHHSIAIDPASLRPKGEWIKTYDGEWMCTHCKEEVSICDCGKDRTYRKPFCPNCGADMRGEENGV